MIGTLAKSEQPDVIGFSENTTVSVIDLSDGRGKGLRLEYERGERHKNTHGTGVEVIVLDHEQARIIGRQLIEE